MILIIIVTFNGQKFIKKCLEDIYNLPQSEILIIDNNSNDKTIEIIENNYPKVHLIKNKENIGFGQANNIGLSYAIQNDFDFVLLLNQDTKIKNQTINALIENIKTYPKYGILSPLHFFEENVLEKYFKYFIKANPILCNDLNNNLFSKNVYDVPYINAAIWLLSRNCIEVVGGFNPSFYHYGEDDNYCHRVIYKGFKIGIVPSLKGFHFSCNNNAIYFKDKIEKMYIKKVIINLSNPQLNFSLMLELAKLIIKLIYDIILFKKQFKLRFKCILLLLSLNFIKIKSNKKHSMYANMAFLNQLN